jgi:F-type H+-transporting ATPase subunit delta
VSLAAVGERYARALFELGEETGEIESLTAQVETAAEVFLVSEDLRAVLDNPLVAEERRDAVLETLAGRLRLGPLVFNLLRLMSRRHRMAALPDVARALRLLTDEKSGVLRATITSATPLGESDLRGLTSELEQKTQRRVVVQNQHDPSLIAGVVTRIGDKTIDGSLKGRLEALERRLLQS